MLIIKPLFDRADDFSEGLACVWIGDISKGKWGFIDKAGNIIIAPQFDSAENFSKGLARVFTRKWGYIDEAGNYVWKSPD